MIESGTPLLSGNAVALVLAPAAGTVYSRVLRRLDQAFAGAADAGAVVVYQGEDVDVIDLSPANGTLYYYKDYGFDGAAFQDDQGAPIAVTPAAAYQDFGPDARVVLMQRLDVGFRQELARGVLKLKGDPGSIPVLSAPPAFKDTKWPVVSVTVPDDSPGTRGIGESILDGIGESDESMLARYAIQIDVWSQNPDERHTLHQSLRRLMQANLAVFTALGFVDMSWGIKDVNFINDEFPGARVYAASMSFSFQAPSGVVAQQSYSIIDAVDVLLTANINVQTVLSGA